MSSSLIIETPAPPSPSTDRQIIRLPRRPRNSPEALATKLPWVQSTGPPITLFRRAAFYLSSFDYKEAATWDLDTVILARVICNLRNYYQQDADQTVKLITKYFHRHSWEVWSPEAIRLTWELVEPYTPSLGLADEDAQSMRRMAELEDEVADLIAHTRSGGRVSTSDLFALFKAWYPDFEVDARVFGKAVKAVTGIDSKSSNSKRYHEGFHLPSPEELLDLNLSADGDNQPEPLLKPSEGRRNAA